MRRYLCAIVAFTLILTISVSAFADAGINNSIIGQSNPGQGQVITMDGYQLILSTGEQYKIAMPAFKQYYSAVQVMYIDAPKNHSVYVYQKPDGDKAKTMPFAFEGTRVYAVADGGNFICIVYQDENYKFHAGWVYRSSLNYQFPGRTATIGSESSYLGCLETDPTCTWSKEYFVGTLQKYTVLASEILNCTQFKYNYQVLNRNGAGINELYGTRTIYVNDGSGWVAAGRFDFDEVQAFLVTVTLPEPMNIRAIAISADCPASDQLSFRQSIQDVITAY